jgi:polyadenylate-binding protein
MNTHLQVVVPQNLSGESGRTVLFVSELLETITESDLENFFQDFKESILVIQINRINRMMESIAPRSLTATVIFKDHLRADDARKGLNLRKIRGKTVRIMWHEKDNSVRYNTHGNLFIKNVSAEVKPRDFYEKFLEFGDIISAKLCEDEEGNHYGYGYVSYYSPESTDAAIRALNEKEVWEGQRLEVVRFQKKNERFQNLAINKNLYVKNLPDNFNENKVRELFSKFGSITWTKVMTDLNARKSAIVSFENEESVQRARDLNNTVVDGNELYVDSLMKKSDRKKILSSRINDNNYKLNSQFKNCNLHLRNVPSAVEESNLHENFSRFGEIKSVKIPKMLLVTKVNNQFKEIPMTKGFAYVCFVDQEAAKKAKEEMNNKFLISFENAKRPLLIDFFMPKYERKQMLNRIQQQYPGKQLPMMNAYGNPFGMPMSLHPNLAKHIRPQGFPQPMNPYNKPTGKPYYGDKSMNNMTQNMPPTNKSDDPDVKYLQSLEDDNSKKDYLGEFIFKKIENHPLAQSYNFTIDTIGKITGMILGIEDINEIVDIALNHDNLTGRISEALNLLAIN